MKDRMKKQTIHIGGLTFDSPFFLAPLAGITDSAFRRICREQGAALVYSEMISAKGLFYNDKSTERLLAFHPDEKPVAFQLFGSDPEILAQAVEKLDGRENCLFDINMGCPVPKVAKNGEGSALMKEPALAAEIVRAMVRAEADCAKKAGRYAKPITVKCRIGWDEKSINAVEFAQRMEEAGAAAIAVHGRTREQYYSGKADWGMIAAVKESISVPVIGSGDVFTAADACRMLAETGCDMVMIARGALGNPWIFREAEALFTGTPYPSPPTPTEKSALMIRHLALAASEKGEHQAVLEMRKHMGWYFKGLPGAAEIRRRVNVMTTLEEMRKTISDYFGAP